MEKVSALISRVNEVQNSVDRSQVGMSFMQFNFEVDITKPILFGFLNRTKSGRNDKSLI